MDYARDIDKLTASTATLYKLTKEERFEIRNEIKDLLHEIDALPIWRIFRERKLFKKIAELQRELDNH